MLTRNDLLGKVFETQTAEGLATFTVVSFDDTNARVHLLNGGKQDVEIAVLLASIRAGIAVESLHAPFVHDEAPVRRGHGTPTHRGWSHARLGIAEWDETRGRWVPARRLTTELEID